MKPFESLKIDINNSIKVFENISQSDSEALIRITKKFIFLKTVYNHPNVSGKEYYYCLLEDALTSIREINNNNQRYFYLNLRSMLENALRMLNFPNSDPKSFSVNKRGLEKIYKEIESDPKFQSILDQMYNQQYTKSCSFVHGDIERINFQNDIDFIYSQFDTSYKPISTSEMLSDLEKALHNIAWIMLPIYYEIIDSIFKDKFYIVYLINSNYKKDLVRLNK